MEMMTLLIAIACAVVGFALGASIAYKVGKADGISQEYRRWTYARSAKAK